MLLQPLQQTYNKEDMKLVHEYVLNQMLKREASVGSKHEHIEDDASGEQVHAKGYSPVKDEIPEFLELDHQNFKQKKKMIEADIQILQRDVDKRNDG